MCAFKRNKSNLYSIRRLQLITNSSERHTFSNNFTIANKTVLTVAFYIFHSRENNCYECLSYGLVLLKKIKIIKTLRYFKAVQLELYILSS